jgi:hypothetical protein
LDKGGGSQLGHQRGDQTHLGCRQRAKCERRFSSARREDGCGQLDLPDVHELASQWKVEAAVRYQHMYELHFMESVSTRDQIVCLIAKWRLEDFGALDVTGLDYTAGVDSKLTVGRLLLVHQASYSTARWPVLQ